MAKKVIDISKWNDVKDWNKVADNIDGVLIRCGYRAAESGQLTIDSKFKIHIKSAVDNNIPVGVYFFSQAINEKEAEEEAKFTISLIKEYKLSLPIFVDSETSSLKGAGRADNLDNETRTHVVAAFCNYIKSHGYESGIYASDSWFKYNLDYNALKNYTIWVARYGKEPETVKTKIGWQYTESGKIPGINGKCDISHWYGNIEKQKIDDEKTPKLDNIINGAAIHLNNINLYPTSSSNKVANRKTGTYYIWSESILNGRVRITNSKSNVGIAGRITGWVNVKDIINNTDNNDEGIKAGDKLNLKSVKFYSSSSALTHTSIRSGVYYIWSTDIVNNRIRITNDISKVGKSNQISAWINISDI